MLSEETSFFFYLVDQRLPIFAATDKFWLKLDINKKIVPNPNISKFGLWLGGVFEKKAMLKNFIEVRQHLLNFDNYQLVKEKWIKFEQQRSRRSFAPFSKKYIDFHKTFIANLETIAYLRCANAAIAVILYQHKYNKLPIKLSQLSPEFISSEDLRDPFSENTLRMKHDSFKAQLRVASPKYAKRTGIRIYSVGLDNIDDGGNVISGICKGKIYSDDITFIIIKYRKSKTELK